LGYAGAMGMPQFMPSSFRNFAADFDNDNHRDIWHNKRMSLPASPTCQTPMAGRWLRFPLSPSPRSITLNGSARLTLAEVKIAQIKTSRPLPISNKVKLLAFEQEQGEELWVALDNFYVITRYNHSPLYAMAVYQLSQAILNKRPHHHE
jgi:membrane-bound lytic murein transglycosylase B